MSKEILYSLRNVSFGYTDDEVLREIDLDIYKGELIGIIGPNGAGKTTLLRILSGYLIPQRGQVIFTGRNIREYDTRNLARYIATLPQSLEIPFSYTVEEFITMGRYPHAIKDFHYGESDREFVCDVMRLMNIESLYGRKVDALSGGERQKVFLAQCLAQDPKVLLLDEPVSHLDIKYQMITLEILQSLHAEGLTIIMVLHDLNLASEFCSRIILLSRGHIHIDDTPPVTLTYENIEEVYNTLVLVRENPLSGKPFIIPISKKYLKKSQ